MTRAFDALGVARDRLIMLPSQPHDEYLQVNACCDAMLDTLHWSGGNTSLDALACGLPVVTLPGRFMRGRQSAAMLRQLDVTDLIAGDGDDYVALASRLVRDAGWRKDLADAIAERQPRLFDTRAPVDAFMALLDSP
jgi:CRISPR-associated protein Csy1